MTYDTVLPVPSTRITLCGSTKFKRQFEIANMWLTLQGYVVYSVSCFGHADNITFNEGEKELLDMVHKWKIDNSDEIFVLDIGGYIGSSTQSEIDYAVEKGKVVRRLSHYTSAMNSWQLQRPNNKKPVIDPR